MTTTTPRRARQDNIYLVIVDGVVSAEAYAISQAESVALWHEHKKAPVIEARLANAFEAREYAHLPFLTRKTRPAAAPEPERDPRVPDMFDDDAALLASETPDDEFAAAVQALPTLAEAVADIVGADHFEDARKMVEEFAPAARDCPTCLHDSPADPAGPCVSCLAGPDGTAPMWEPAASQASPATAEDGRTTSADLPPLATRRINAAHPAAKYRDPATGATWTGRGLKPRWLVAAIDAGKTADEFLING